MTADHGYGRYTNGCRCTVCRAAKADYMRERRAKARANAQPDVKVGGILHGTRCGYEESGCRCRLCVAAKRVTWRVEGWPEADRRKARGRAA